MRSRRILIVDDSAVARQIARRSLERRGAEVEEACSRAEALSSLDAAFDGVLLDLELGDGTGLDVFDALAGGSARVAFISATTDESLLGEARARAPLFHKPDGVTAAVDWLLA